MPPPSCITVLSRGLGHCSGLTGARHSGPSRGHQRLRVQNSRVHGFCHQEATCGAARPLESAWLLRRSPGHCLSSSPLSCICLFPFLRLLCPRLAASQLLACPQEGVCGLHAESLGTRRRAGVYLWPAPSHRVGAMTASPAWDGPGHAWQRQTSWALMKFAPGFLIHGNYLLCFYKHALTNLGFHFSKNSCLQTGGQPPLGAPGPTRVKARWLRAAGCVNPATRPHCCLPSWRRDGRERVAQAGSVFAVGGRRPLCRCCSICVESQREGWEEGTHCLSRGFHVRPPSRGPCSQGRHLTLLCHPHPVSE